MNCFCYRGFKYQLTRYVYLFPPVVPPQPALTLETTESLFLRGGNIPYTARQDNEGSGYETINKAAGKRTRQSVMGVDPPVRTAGWPGWPSTAAGDLLSLSHP